MNTSPKKVLHLTYDMRIGGTEMVIKNIIEGSNRNFFLMSIFCIEEPIGPWGVELQSQGINITAKARKPGFDLKLIAQINRHLRENNIDVIHCHQYTPWVYGVIAAIGTKTKVIFTEHGRFYPDSSSWKRKLINPVLCIITDHVTSISKATKQALVEYENIPKNRIEVVYNGIAALKVNPSETQKTRAKLDINSSTTVIGTIARLDPIKNHKMMINAFAIIAKQIDDIKLIIVGDGEERENIQAQISNLGLEDKVRLTGYDPRPQRYLELMDIYLLSSLSEGTSMTLLEAMSLGKPCIATDAGGNPEIVKNFETGLVTSNDDAAKFADAVMTLINQHEMLSSYGQEGKRVFDSSFNVTKMNEKYALLYQS